MASSQVMRQQPLHIATGDGDGSAALTVTPAAVDMNFLNVAQPVTCAEMLKFERGGHLLTRGLFSAQEMALLSPHIMAGFRALELSALQQKVTVLLGEGAAPPGASAEDLLVLLRQLPPDEIPFLQVFNMWRTPGAHAAAVSALVRSRRLARHAAALLGCQAVRVYQDSTFVKRSGDGPTNWHSGINAQLWAAAAAPLRRHERNRGDLNMAPFDTNDMVTAWLPLTHIAACEDGGSGLVFASRSHRDFALNYWQDPHAQEDLSERYDETPQLAMEPGDCSWHHGWVLHSANGNDTPETRVAFTVSYIADGARMLGEGAEHYPEQEGADHYPDQEDTWSYSDWIADTCPGEPADHPFLPVAFDFAEEVGLEGLPL
ncbi:hypothetical protein JKP88DRAFT_346961 [Tribonema minus]|uniref:Phytanoyl-CoA dioxygenase n=1 Tax=Tribonema minus TaxID=303371 RepID=A0A835YLJ4_9STRA|nr:hypothetical protein JKP88DRAFT_346961 [Tribonema minus]